MAVAAMLMPTPAPQPQTFTYAEYLATPLTGSYAIVDGVLIEMPSPSWSHQERAARVFESLRAYQRSRQNGRTLMAPFDVVVQQSPLRTRQPDVFYISNERLAEAGGIPQEGPLPLGPELVVEILSPSETPRTVREKLEDLAAVGTREAWLVSPESETVQVLRLSPEGIEPAAVYIYGQTLTSLTFPELTIALADIFDD